MRPNGGGGGYAKLICTPCPARSASWRRRGGSVQRTQQPVPMMQQQMVPRGHMYCYPPGCNDILGVAGGMLPVPYDMGAMLPRDAALAQPMPITALASALANAPADQ